MIYYIFIVSFDFYCITKYRFLVDWPPLGPLTLSEFLPYFFAYALLFRMFKKLKLTNQFNLLLRNVVKWSDTLLLQDF